MPRAKRDYEQSKAQYDTEVNTAKAEAELAYSLQVIKSPGGPLVSYSYWPTTAYGCNSLFKSHFSAFSFLLLSYLCPFFC